MAMLVSYLANDTWSLPSLSRSTGYGLINISSVAYQLVWCWVNKIRQYPGNTVVADKLGSTFSAGRMPTDDVG